MYVLEFKYLAADGKEELLFGKFSFMNIQNGKHLVKRSGVKLIHQLLNSYNFLLSKQQQEKEEGSAMRGLLQQP